jgi:hypothetical protein
MSLLEEETKASWRKQKNAALEVHPHHRVTVCLWLLSAR